MPLEKAPPPKKAIVCSRSFGRPVESLEEMKEAVTTYVSSAAEKLRRQRSAAFFLTVFISTNYFSSDLPKYSNSVTYRLPEPSAYTPRLTYYAHQGLERIFRSGYQYKKAGIMLTEIVPENQVQINLLTPSRSHKKETSVMIAVDRINARWGRKTVKYLGEGIKQAWRMKQSRKSRRFTTCWKELPIVKASFPYTLASL
jgi:DNA polymerase V